MQNVGTTEQGFPIDFLGVEGDVSEEKHFPIFHIFEILNFDLVGQKFIESSVEDVLNEIFDRTEIGEAVHNFSKKVAEDHTLQQN